MPSYNFIYLALGVGAKANTVPLTKPVREAIAAEARLDLARAMAVLPERTRRLIDGVKLQGATVAEAAQATGMTETAAKVAIHRGLQAMAKFLSKRRTGP